MVEIGYWDGFKKRKKDKITTKRDARYGLDRSIWSTYYDFFDVYHFKEESMAEAKVSKELSAPLCMFNPLLILGGRP